MKIEIDLSGKVEDTAKDTVLAFCNGFSFTICLSSSTKKRLQNEFRLQGKGRLYVYKTFTALIVLLLEPYLTKIQQVYIDIEYFGKNDLLKDMIINYLQKLNLTIPEIHFQRIGNAPKVHYIAYNTFLGKTSASRNISYEEIAELIWPQKKIDRYLSECLSTRCGT